MLKTEFKQKMSEVLPSMSIMETTEGELIVVTGEKTHYFSGGMVARRCTI